MPVISSGSIQNALKKYKNHSQETPRRQASHFTNAGYSVVKPMQLPGFTPRGAGHETPHSARGSTVDYIEKMQNAAKSPPPCRNSVENVAIPSRSSGQKTIVARDSININIRSTIVKVAEDDFISPTEGPLPSEGLCYIDEYGRGRSKDSPRAQSKDAKGNRRDSVRWNTLELARERAAEEDRMANRSVKKIEIALRHMNDQKSELAEMKNQMQALLKPQMKLERVTMQRERAKTAAQIMAPLNLGGQLLPKKKKELGDFFDESELTEEEKELRAMAKKTGIDLPDVQDYKRWFDKVDLDGSGQIERPEFEGLMKELHPGVELRKQQVDDWWRGVDVDQSGEITFEEFLEYWATQM